MAGRPEREVGRRFQEAGDEKKEDASMQDRKHQAKSHQRRRDQE